MVNCLICSNKSFLIRNLGKKSIYKCSFCNVEFCYPMPSEKELEEFYKNYKYYSQYDEKTIANVIKKNMSTDAKFLKKYGLTEQSRLLDYGCGENYFVLQGNSKNWIGYDYPKGKIPNGKFDFILLFGVLEHLSNPLKILKDLNSRLNPNGKIIIRTVETETDIPYRYRVPIHLVWWSKKSIEEIFKKSGFRLKEVFNYYMFNDPKIYLDRVLDRGRVSDKIKKKININIKDYIRVPTNEIFIVAQKIK